MENEDKIIEHLMKIREDVAGIKEHLCTLNGKVARNVKEIEDNRLGINCIKEELKSVTNKISYYSGAAALFFIIFQVFFRFILN